MAKKSKTQKRLAREREMRERYMELPLLPEELYEDDDGVLLLPDGSYLPNGFYRTADGGHFLYEGDPSRTLVDDQTTA